MTEMVPDAPAVTVTGRRDRRGHYGALRALCAIPSICGSLLVLALAFGWAGPWADLVLAGWLAVGLALLFRPFERAAVAVAFGYCKLTAREASVMDAARRQALDRCDVSDQAIDLYVRRRSSGVNARAAGGRSVAVSAGLLSALEGGRLSNDQAVAVLFHEIGHLAGRDVRYGLVIGWLTVPWRAALAVFAGLMRATVRHVPTARAALLLVPVVGSVAVVQMVEHDAWASLAVLAGLALVMWVQPLAESAVSRLLDQPRGRTRHAPAPSWRATSST